MGLQVTIDFEGRSESPLPKVGAFRYSTDPTTQVVCLAYTHKDNEGLVRVWIAPWILEKYDIEPGYHSCTLEDGTQIEAEFVEGPEELLGWLEEAETVEAHNAFFERCIWRNIMIPRYQWPDIPNKKWRCSAAKAASFALPRSLEGAGEAMRLDILKDQEGSKLLRKMMKPLPISQQKKAGGKYHENREDFIRQALYCARDVDSEEAFSHSLPNLIPFEQRVWEVDQDANERGVYCDIDFVNHVLDMCDAKVAELAGELYDLTEGSVTSPGSRQAVLNWVEAQGFHDLPNTQGATIDALLERDDIDPTVYRVIKIVRLANRTSTRKYYAMQRRVGEDGRIRDTLMYHGANTGRWSGRGVQFQNLPRGMIKDMDLECDFIANATLDEIEMIYEDAMELFASAVRGAIAAPEGKDLLVADYSSIEARGTPWAAGDDRALEIFRRGEDIYCDMASTIYGRKIEKKKHPKERQLGKQAILGLGYGMGANKFLVTCWNNGIEFDLEEMLPLVTNYEKIKAAILKMPHVYFKDEVTQEEHMDHMVISKFIVDNYRQKYAKTVQFWKDCEEAATRAVQDYENYDRARADLKKVKKDGGSAKAVQKAIETLGKTKKRKTRWHKAGVVKYRVVGRFLLCQLPSGRRLAYPYPKLKMKKTSWGADKNTIHFKGVDSVTKRWGTQTTYGGKLVENVVQAIARDLMANAMVLVDDDPTYDIVLTVHDEIVTEVIEGQGCVKEFEDLISTLPSWANGFPLAAEGWRGKRYRK